MVNSCNSKITVVIQLHKSTPCCMPGALAVLYICFDLFVKDAQSLRMTREAETKLLVYLFVNAAHIYVFYDDEMSSESVVSQW